MRAWKNFLLHAFFPTRCVFCGRIINWREDCCEACLEKLKFLDAAQCARCGQEYCICAERGSPFVRVLAVFPYEEAYKAAILRLKFGRDRAAGAILGKYLAQQVLRWRSGVRFDLVVPVPLSPEKRKRRGYNQAALLAEAAAVELHSIVDGEILIKVRATQEQHTLTREQRRHNLADAFAVRNPERLAGKAILLVDDVYTTGATTAECAKVLLQAGAVSVTAAAVCRTVVREQDG